MATPLGAPLRGHSPLWPSGEALHREGAAHRPYWGAGPSLAIGLWATGLPLATYWPSGEGPLATDWPPTGHPGRPLTGHPLATKGRERNFVRPSLTYGAPAPTGHLREPKTDLAKWRLWPPTPPPPHQPIEAFGRGGPHPPPTGHPLAIPGPPPLPRLSGAVATGRGGGLFACKVCRYEGARVPYTPFGDPYPHRLATYGHRPTPPYWPPTPPHLLTGQRVGGTGHLWPKWCGFFPALTPTTLLEWGDVLLGLLL